jgi:flagellar export protein FliJ
MAAMSTMSYLGFIGQIEEVVQRQENEVGRLEAACARQWEELIEIRREKRTYEIVSEKAAERELATALRRSQAEIDDLLQRVNRTP